MKVSSINYQKLFPKSIEDMVTQSIGNPSTDKTEDVAQDIFSSQKEFFASHRTLLKLFSNSMHISFVTLAIMRCLDYTLPLKSDSALCLGIIIGGVSAFAMHCERSLENAEIITPKKG